MNSRPDQQLKSRHERAVLEQFVRFLATTMGRRWTIESQGESPDFACRDASDRTFGVEVTTTYYDEAEAQARWTNAKGGTSGWAGQIDPVPQIQERIDRKCSADYGSSAVLLVHFPSALTEAHEIDALIRQLKIPSDTRFSEIWLGVDLPGSGGYRAWQLSKAGV